MMTFSDLANPGEFISSVAVLISLIYLARQTGQNSEHGRALIRQGRLAVILVCFMSLPLAVLPAAGQTPAAPQSAAPMPPIPGPPNQINPADRQACSVKGGDYGYWGLSPKPFCNIRFKDGGKRCSDKSDCEGRCLLDGQTPEHNQQVSGRCETHLVTYGCTSEIHDGHAAAPECLE